MISEKNLRTVLIAALFTSITLYVLIADYLPEIFGISTDWSIFNVAGIIVSTIMVLNSLKIRFILKLIYGSEYIEGFFIGKSQMLSDDENQSIIHQEKFRINQYLLLTKIAGDSYLDGEFYSSWSGKLFSVDNNQYQFLVTIQTPSGVRTGIIDLHIYNEEVNGFAISSISGINYKWKFTMRRTNKKDYDALCSTVS